MDTFGNVIMRTLERAERPLTPAEIWSYSATWNTRGDFRTTGKTPDATVAAHLYSNMKSLGEKSPYVMVQKRPSRFWLKKRSLPEGLTSGSFIFSQESVAPEPQGEKFNERSLHRFVATFVETDSHFRAKTKTIYHESSKKSKKGVHQWLHPDMVGVRYPFEDLEPVTLEAQLKTNNSSIKFFAFELKLAISLANLRMVYFQAVSNASWAHEGYLVALRIEDRLEVIDECRRLTNAFGIGLIQIDVENVHESQILLPARTSTTLDWEMMNKITQVNPDFKSFLETVTTDMTIKKVTNPLAFDLTGNHEDGKMPAI